MRLSAGQSTWRECSPEIGEHPHPPTVPSGHSDCTGLSSTDRAKETRTQARVSETCIFFLLIVNLFTTNIVKEFSNKTRKNPEDFVFLLCRILRKHHRTARKEILKTNQQPHLDSPCPGPRSSPRSGGDCRVWGGTSRPPLPLPLPSGA